MTEYTVEVKFTLRIKSESESDAAERADSIFPYIKNPQTNELVTPEIEVIKET